jgi:hypothetical protein
MSRDERFQLPILMALHLLWGVVLYFSISKYGLGVSTDAVQLLFGGQNLAAGNGLTSYDGMFIAFWPPLYPAVLALVRLITGADMLIAATVVNALAFLGLGLALSVLFLRVFSGRLIPAAAALLLAQAGVVVVTAAGTVGSDYLHLFLAFLVVLLAASHVENGSRAAFAGLAITAMLATLQRYLGVAATATAIAAILLLSKASWRRRLADAGLLGLTMLPMALWLALTSRLYARRGPITFEENFSWFSRSVLEWFVGSIPRRVAFTAETVVLWVLVVALAAAALLLARSARGGEQTASGRETWRREAWPYVAVFLLYGLIYTLALFGSASIAYFNKLGGRFILPLYVPLISLPVIVADGLVQAAKRAGRRALAYGLTIAGAIAVLGLGVMVLRTTYPVVIESHGRGVAGGENSFNNEGWRENPAIRFWEGHAPTGEFLLFSNEPDGVAFYTRHAARPAPRRISGPYGTDVMPVADFKEEMFGPGLDVYLIWIEPSTYDYYYAPQRLEEIAAMENLFSNELGSVYRLSPKRQD